MKRPLEYTGDVGEAGQCYLDELTQDAEGCRIIGSVWLPGTFRWEELFNRMQDAAVAPQPGAIPDPPLDQEVGYLAGECERLRLQVENLRRAIMLSAIRQERPELYDKLCKMQLDMVAEGGVWEKHHDTFCELADWTEDLLGKMRGGDGSNSKPDALHV